MSFKKYYPSIFIVIFLFWLIVQEINSIINQNRDEREC